MTAAKPEETFAVLARAILEINRKAVRTWDGDDGQSFSEGLYLTDERAIEEIASRTHPAPTETDHEDA